MFKGNKPKPKEEPKTDAAPSSSEDENVGQLFPNSLMEQTP